MTEQERREYFAFLNGVAADMKESRKEIIDLLEGIKAERAEIDTQGHPNGIVVRHKAIKIINRHIKEYTK